MTEINTLDPGQLKHGMAVIDAKTRIHYVTAGTGGKTVVLLHGFPQTWWEWRYIIAPLVKSGFRVVAPDYRGAGESWRPESGYDKKTMATDLNKLIKSHLKITGPIIIVGHDIGLMVAYAYAQAYRADVSHLVVIDAPLPGTKAFTQIRSDPRVWHFSFHSVLDLPEMLIAGSERQYLQSFFNYRIFNTAAIDSEDMDIFVNAYSAPGAIRSGLALYRAFDQDIQDNQESLKKNGKLSIPVLAVGGEISTSGSLMEDMMLEVAENVTAVRITETAHWVVEENPKEFIKAFLSFMQQ